MSNIIADLIVQQGPRIYWMTWSALMAEGLRS